MYFFQIPVQMSVINRLHQDEINIAENNGENIVEIMGNAPSLSRDRLHLLRLDQFIFHCLAIGNIPYNRKYSRFSADNRVFQRHFYPEAVAVSSPGVPFENLRPFLDRFSDKLKGFRFRIGLVLGTQFADVETDSS